MKIEKINENQIRCTLTRADLEARKIRLSELAYGSEKAKDLFRDMMAQAYQDCGFEVNNIPLMIEAVPVSMDQLVLIITKVQDPEELDTRFSRFSSDDPQRSGSSGTCTDALSGADDILNLIKKITDSSDSGDGDNGAGAADSGSGRGGSSASGRNSDVDGGIFPALRPAAQAGSTGASRSASSDAVSNFTAFYLFQDFETAIRASKALAGREGGGSTIYKNEDDGSYYLLIRKGDTSPEEFNRICNILSEYAMPMDYTSGMDEFFNEHMKILVNNDAVAELASL